MPARGSWWSLLVACIVLAATLLGQAPARDWPQFGSNAVRSSDFTGYAGITAKDLPRLVRRQVTVPGIVDSSAIYLHQVEVKGAAHNVAFMTTAYGQTFALDTNSGELLWTWTPPDYAGYEGTRQITNSTPIAGPDRTALYAASPDGYVEKLAISDGHLIWRTAVTLLPAREKLDSPLSLAHGNVIVPAAGYVGDRPPYQGHVAVLDAASGKLEHVWNSLCSDRGGLMQPSSCNASDAAIWGRAGVVLEPATGNILFATGNAPWNGATNWGDAVLELDPDATRLLGNWTPANTDQLNDQDLDLGSTSPAWLGDGLIAQGGKDGLIRLLSLRDIAGTAPHQGHELSSVATPSGTDLFTALAVSHAAGTTWLFAADDGGSAAWTVEANKLVDRWRNQTPGTSPVVAGGLLYVYDQRDGALKIYEPETGKLLASLPCGRGHWNSPIAVDGTIILPEGNADTLLGRGRRVAATAAAGVTTGLVDLWTLPQ